MVTNEIDYDLEASKTFLIKPIFAKLLSSTYNF